jgi:preprotein translocase subunit SecE
METCAQLRRVNWLTWRRIWQNALIVTVVLIAFVGFLAVLDVALSSWFTTLFGQ